MEPLPGRVRLSTVLRLMPALTELRYAGPRSSYTSMGVYGEKSVSLTFSKRPETEPFQTSPSTRASVSVVP